MRGLQVSVILQNECGPYIISGDYPHLHLSTVMRRTSPSLQPIVRRAHCIVVLGDFEWLRGDLLSADWKYGMLINNLVTPHRIRSRNERLITETGALIGDDDKSRMIVKYVQQRSEYL